MSGFVVEHIGYPAFFVYTASLSIVGLVFLYVLTRYGLTRSGVLTGAPRATTEFALEEGADVPRT
jgi:hypothetical protein